MNLDTLTALLPGVFQRTATQASLLVALLEGMLELLDPVESQLDRIDERFDPRRTPEEFLPFLASWVGLDSLLDPVHNKPGEIPKSKAKHCLASGSGPLRELIAAASRLSHWRGTQRGLLDFLETATGLRGFHIEENPREGHGDQVRPFHMQVRAPQAAADYESLIRRIVAQEKPVCMTSELRFQSRPGGRA